MLPVGRIWCIEVLICVPLDLVIPFLILYLNEIVEDMHKSIHTEIHSSVVYNDHKLKMT